MTDWNWDEDGYDFHSDEEFYDAVRDIVWDDDYLMALCLMLGMDSKAFWEIVCAIREGMVDHEGLQSPAMTEAEAVNEALTDESELSCSRCPHGMCPGGCEIERNAYWNDLF